MIVVLDASAAVEIVLKRLRFDALSERLLDANLVLSPDLYVSEITNVFWKYHTFASIDYDRCEKSIELSIDLVDEFVPAQRLYREAFSLAVQTEHPVYDCLYLVLSRRNNALLLSMDKKLKRIANDLGIKSA